MIDPTTAFRFRPIGVVRSPYREKFAVPRQPGLVPAARGELHLIGQYNREEILRGLSGFSHLWLTFVFHQVMGENWSPTVRPPRLGGNRRLGVFATRSPYRPNPIGLSAVRLVNIGRRGQQWVLTLTGIDLVDGTPVLDIKPYIPYADAIADASGGFTEDLSMPPAKVEFSPESREQLACHSDAYPDLETLIRQVIGQHPQPGYQRSPAASRIYGMYLHRFNIRFRATDTGYQVVSIDDA